MTAPFETERMIGAAISLATVLFLMAVAPGFPYRRAARIAALAIYGTVLAGVVVWVVLWLFGMAPGR